jgi:hypothetical protein
MSVVVLMSADSQADFVDLPVTIQERVTAVVERLKRWPNVSGAKPMRALVVGSNEPWDTR